MFLLRCVVILSIAGLRLVCCYKHELIQTKRVTSLRVLPPEILISEALPIEQIVRTALEKAAAKGSAGASAGAVQVLSLMWLRTAMNYQYKTGLSTVEALKDLYAQGGLPRLYQGVSFAIVQGPLSRFGDTAANALIYSLVDAVDPTGAVPAAVRTALASVSAAGFRLVIMPIDTAKTCLQVNGKDGLKILLDRIAAEGPGVLFAGSLATFAATFVGHYPWFLTYNYLTAALPTAEDAQAMLLPAIDARLLDVSRSAFIGLSASCASDVCSNSLRVLKTYRQADRDNLSYQSSVAKIVSEQGWGGLFGRGLQTRLLSNALQGVLFSVLFKYFQHGAS